MAKPTLADLNAFFSAAFPGEPIAIEAADDDGARCRLRILDRALRPDGIVAGPTLMILADWAMFALALRATNLEVGATTSSLTISFLRKAPRADLIAEARMLKHGASTIVGDVHIHSDGADEPCAHAVVTVVLPRR